MRPAIPTVVGAAGILAAALLAVGTAPALAPAATADGLQRFGSCTELRQWYVAAAADRVGPWGWKDGSGGGVMVPMAVDAERSAAGAAPASAGAEATGSSATGTNVQEAGVDEPDVAKTDGTLLARVSGRTITLDDVSGSTPRQLATYPLPDGVRSAQLLLVGQRLVVVGEGGGRAYPLRELTPDLAGPTTDNGSTDNGAGSGPVSLPGSGVVGSVPLTTSGTRVLVLDVSDPASPRLVGDHSFADATVTARQYDDVVRLVVTRDRPNLRFDYGPRAGSTARNRGVVAATTWRDWVPTVRDEQTGATTPLTPCDQVLRPTRGRGTGSVSVVGFRPAQPDDLDTTTLAADGGVVYSSPDAMYVATTRDRDTLVHELDLSGTSAGYAASGEVAGTVKDSWSMDAHDGRLRLAVATGAQQTTDDGAHRAGANAVVVMRRDGGRLVETGRQDGLGAGEEIKSVRWFDDLAVVVTFRQLDPLYAVDLSDPDHPRTAGELEMPGFSGYLHPIGNHRLLGIGVDAGSDGRPRGGLAQVFDVTDPAHPQLLDRLTFGTGAWLDAVQDPHAFTFLPATDTAYAGGYGGVLRLHVDDAGHLTSSGDTDSSVYGGQTRTLPLPGTRIAVVDDQGVILQPA